RSSRRSTATPRRRGRRAGRGHRGPGVGERDLRGLRQAAAPAADPGGRPEERVAPRRDSSCASLRGFIMVCSQARRVFVLLAAACVVAATLSVRQGAAAVARLADKDDAGARAAFLDVYKVLMHPRCLNCHPSGDAPLQGDDSHVHLQNVKRGEDGKGKYALKCTNCHQDTNLPGENMPPGNPTWQLPRKVLPLLFQGKS